ncbi:serine/threonine-protein kinase pim-1-like isoform X2 [Poecile atricapillus]|uniref:serine/threonine-protein kinase pim-1-like isoform X2 n=1 Tax=Poecile atricapillus TaxID=48891 RepID=UPI00273A0394|nr:serine/threonine-protein kinase pim-1-like isoform X2 [Poecile atricapillus]
MPRPARRPWASRPPARPCRARLGPTSARFSPHCLWRLWKSFWKSSSLWWWGSGTVFWLRLVRALAQPRTRPLPEPPRCRPAPAPSPAASPSRARPLVSWAAGPESPEPGAAREAAVPGAVGCSGQNAESAVAPGRAEKPPLEQLYRQGSLLGSGGCGSVYSGTRLADGAPVAIKRVSRDRISEWARLHDGALVPLELALLWMVSCPGFRGVVRLLDWFQLPDGFALVMERPERFQDLWYFLDERGFLTETVARGLFCQVLEAVRHCTSRGVLHRDIKAENIVLDLATGEAKLIDFGCGTILRDTLYTRMSGCQHLIRWCLSMDPADRPSLEDLLEHSWLQDPHLAQKTAEIHPSTQWGDPGAQQVPAARVSRRSKKIPERFPAAVEQRREHRQDASAGPQRAVEGAAQCSPSCWRSRDSAVKLPRTGEGETSPCSSMAS